MSIKDNISYSINAGRYDELCKIKKLKSIENNRIIKHKSLLNDILYDREYNLLSINKLIKKYHIKYEYMVEILNEYKLIPLYNIKCVETGELFETIDDANKKYSVTTIKDVISGRQKTAAGHKWEKIIFPNRIKKL